MPQKNFMVLFFSNVSNNVNILFGPLVWVILGYLGAVVCLLRRSRETLWQLAKRRRHDVKIPSKCDELKEDQ